MKRLLTIVGLVLIIGIGSAFVYADSPIGNRFGYKGINNEEMEQWHQERMEWGRENLKEDVEKGYITEDEAKEWEDHYDYMEDFHNRNGFGGCHGGRRGMGMMRGRFGRRPMMGW